MIKCLGTDRWRCAAASSQFGTTFAPTSRCFRQSAVDGDGELQLRPTDGPNVDASCHQTGGQELRFHLTFRERIASPGIEPIVDSLILTDCCGLDRADRLRTFDECLYSP